ncbi:hypothetical protein [Tengunoibacter tsumagoiensis]|uniref:Uncharacterized protein n=1 Tax=Tengunoibacter tsumagoiensis TaxID=2014871 RepID=A0A402A1E4_9CHLR|nr:hypothetical protein [Tengunoibacter tsumagoiensis]GCE12980.1 hypothetical protein KTT_28390 [Tengunoibacter tsumagoiensis]
MSNFLWVMASLISYIAGLIVLIKVTPQLLSRSYDEGLFMAIAAADIVGAMLAFSGVIIPLLLFGGAIWIKLLDAVLLVGIFAIAARLAWFSLRPHMLQGVYRISRIGVGVYCALLALGAFYYIIQIFLV